MPGWHRFTLLAFLLAPFSGVTAELFRCQAEDGSISFNQHGCPTDTLRQRQHLNTTNLSQSPPRPIAQDKARTRSAAQTLVVVAEQDDGCGNLLSSRERRHHIIKKQIHSGMSRRDVENALGKPEKISSRNGRTHYQYTKQRISFDQAGCVSRK